MLTNINVKALVLGIIVFFMALFAGGAFAARLFILTLLIILATLYSGRNISKNLVDIVWKNSDRIQAGERLKLNIELYNSSIFPIPFIRVNTNLSDKLTGQKESKQIYSIMSSQKLNLSRDILCKNKGIYKIGYLEVEFSDVFNIFNWKKKFDTDILLYVYPKVHQLTNFVIPSRQHFGTVAVRHNAYEDFASIKDIRKYVNGDSYKKIHWKVTAHRGDFHVKNVDLNATADVNVFMDLYKENYIDDVTYEVEEIVAECTASVIKHALTKKMSVSYIAKSSSLIRVSGTGLGKFSDFLDGITRSETNGDIPIYELVRNEGQKLNLGATAVVVTTDINEQLLDTLLSFGSKGISFVIINVSKNKDEQNSNAEVLKQHGIKVYTVYTDDDIVQALGGYYEK